MAKTTNEKPRTILKICQKNISKKAGARCKRFPTKYNIQPNEITMDFELASMNTVVSA